MIPSDNDANNDNNEENIRIPDSVFNERLISSYESDDEEMNLALEVSRNEYLNEINSTYNDTYNDTYIGTQLKLAIDISIEEETAKLEEIAKNESIKLQLEVERNLEIVNRKKSLEEFSKNKNFKDSHEYKCKECKNNYNNIYNEKK